MAPNTVFPAHQARSRESLRKLLRAATEVLGRYGMEGATIPRIARHAGLTPGSVYRRFHDKDALLQTAILEVLERQEETMKNVLAPLAGSQVPLPVFAGKIISGMVGTYRANAGLLRAMRQFLQERAHSAFGRKAAALRAAHFQRTVELFLSYGNKIRHPRPRAAVAMALMMVVGTLYHLVVWPDQAPLQDLLPQDDEAMAQELTHAFLSYLEVER